MKSNTEGIGLTESTIVGRVRRDISYVTNTTECNDWNSSSTLISLADVCRPIANYLATSARLPVIRRTCPHLVAYVKS